MHLEGSRREAFRQARAVLSNAQGHQTIAFAEDHFQVRAESRTLIEGPQPRVPADIPCWLTDDRQVFPLHIGLNTIGRASENDVVLADPTVSRRHCGIIVHSNGRSELHDTASKNGTCLNGRTLSHPANLREGDVLVLSDSRLIFHTRAAERSDSRGPTLSKSP